MTQKRAKQFSPESRERAVRMVQDREREGGTQGEPVGAIAAKISCSRGARPWDTQVGQLTQRYTTHAGEIMQATAL